MTKYKTGNLFGGDETEEVSAGHVIRAAFESGVDNEFDYIVPDKFWPVQIGQRVEVPFGRSNKLEKAFCVDILSPAEAQRDRGFKLKAVKSVIDKEPLLDPQLMALARWISTYYVCPLGQVLAAMVPAAVKKGAGLKKDKYIYLAKAAEKKVTSKKQQAVIDILQARPAFDPENAILKSELLLEAECREGVLKTLSRNKLINTVSREVFKSPPAVPQGAAAADLGKEIILNDEQQKALSAINSRLDAANFGVTLLHGVTDSGKTEVYIRAIQKAIEKGKSAIVLLPEIALTTQTIGRFSKRFERIAVMHSQLTGPQRNAQWRKIKKDRADVVIGARSAVFAPLSDPGLIIIDEEHESSYKQDTVPRYNARDVAIKRAQLAEALCLLGSATPSLETLINCRTKKHFTLLRLPRRVMGLPMPEMQLVDIASQFAGGSIGLISPQLQDRLEQTLAKGQQAILLLNRRGYSNFVYCPSCGHTLHCRNCDVTLTFHKRSRKKAAMDTVTGDHFSYGHAICHYCLAKTLVPKRCPLCKKKMTMIGLGSQKLEEELIRKLPNARISRLDSDAMAGKDTHRYYRVLKDFADGRTDILAGTQMLAKGLHFPNVTLVGIVSADTSLSLPDFRANERTFQLISQVAGRAGRSAKRSVVIVQTLLADNPAIKFALKHDYDGFVEAELPHRQACNLPPYWRMAIVTLRDTKFDKLTEASEAMKWRLDRIVDQYTLEVKVRGPMPATISRIQQFHRIQIIVQAPNPTPIQQLFAELRSGPPIRPAVKVAIDIDPVNLM